MAPSNFTMLPQGRTRQAGYVLNELSELSASLGRGQDPRLRFPAYMRLVFALNRESAFDWVTTANLIAALLRAAEAANTPRQTAAQLRIEEQSITSARHLVRMKGNPQ